VEEKNLIVLKLDIPKEVLDIHHDYLEFDISWKTYNDDRYVELARTE
jgi:hypothetical protein